jgi:hypothetical protein
MKRATALVLMAAAFAACTASGRSRSEAGAGGVDEGAATNKEQVMSGTTEQGGGAGGASASASQPLSLTASLSGTSVHLTLQNRSSAALKVNSHVQAGSRVDLDWFVVTLRFAGDTRDLRFSGPRNRAAQIRQTLDPGASLSHDVDLAWWAQQEVNGNRPLPTGKGTLTVVYEVSGDPEAWNGRVEATAIEASW